MDPNETLRTMLDLARKVDADDEADTAALALSAYVLALDNWQASR